MRTLASPLSVKMVAISNRICGGAILAETAMDSASPRQVEEATDG